MAFAAGLAASATTYAENDSKSARKSLLVRVIKGSNMLTCGLMSTAMQFAFQRKWLVLTGV